MKIKNFLKDFFYDFTFADFIFIFLMALVFYGIVFLLATFC